jgi:hypothetical protein
VRTGDKAAQSCFSRTEASRAFAKRSDAEKHATLQEADAQRGVRSADPKRGAIAVQDYSELRFLPAMLHLRSNSADTYASHLRNHIYPLLGNRRLGTITRSDVQAFVSAVSGRVAASTTETVDFLRRKIHVLSQAQRGQLAADLKTEA